MNQIIFFEKIPSRSCKYFIVGRDCDNAEWEPLGRTGGANRKSRFSAWRILNLLEGHGTSSHGDIKASQLKFSNKIRTNLSRVHKINKLLRYLIIHEN